MNLQKLKGDLATTDWTRDSALIFMMRSLAWVLLTGFLIRANLFVWGIY